MTGYLMNWLSLPIEMTEKEHHCLIGLGTNLGDKFANLEKAKEEIADRCGRIVSSSFIYMSSPWGYESKNGYLNQCLLIRTEWLPGNLLKRMLLVEQEMGRERRKKEYTDRIIDIDILFYDQLVMDTPDLKIPHPLVGERLFVLKPLLDIAPGYIHPGFNKTVRELYDQCPDTLEVRRVSL